MKVSIITICYNSALTIRETIKSVIRQGYTDLEYLIIDGGSTDETLNIIEKYREKISYVVTETDRGISDAFNKGIKASTGDVIGIINSDDFLAENAVKNIAQYADKYRHMDVFYGDMAVINGRGEIYICRPQEEISNIKHHFMLCHPSVFIRREAYKRYGLYDMEYRYAMDYELLSRFYNAGAAFQYVPELLAYFRKGGTSKANARMTVDESIKVSIRNGTEPNKARNYYRIANMRQQMFDVFEKLRIELFLRKAIRGQENIDEDRYWFEK